MCVCVCVCTYICVCVCVQEIRLFGYKKALGNVISYVF